MAGVGAARGAGVAGAVLFFGRAQLNRTMVAGRATERRSEWQPFILPPGPRYWLETGAASSWSSPNCRAVVDLSIQSKLAREIQSILLLMSSIQQSPLRARDAYVHSVDRALFTTIAAPERAASPETETTEKARTAEVTGCSRLRSGSRPLHPTFVIVIKSQMFRINSRRIHPYSYPYIGNRALSFYGDPEAET